MGDLYGEKKVDIRETTNYLIILRNYIAKKKGNIIQSHLKRTRQKPLKAL